MSVSLAGPVKRAACHLPSPCSMDPPCGFLPDIGRLPRAPTSACSCIGWCRFDYRWRGTKQALTVLLQSLLLVYYCCCDHYYSYWYYYRRQLYLGIADGLMSASPTALCRHRRRLCGGIADNTVSASPAGYYHHFYLLLLSRHYLYY